MNIARAVEILQTIVQTGEYEGDPDDSTAINLGIEALKRLQEARRLEACERRYLLPGETEGE